MLCNTLCVIFGVRQRHIGRGGVLLHQRLSLLLAFFDCAQLRRRQTRCPPTIGINLICVLHRTVLHIRILHLVDIIHTIHLIGLPRLLHLLALHLFSVHLGNRRGSKG